MTIDTLPATLFVSGQRKKMGYKNGASKHGKVLTADNHRYWSCRNCDGADKALIINNNKQLQPMR